MAGLQRNKHEGGKYPIVLRRDGSVLQTEYFVLALKDPGAEAALMAYADAVEKAGMDPLYVTEVRQLAMRSNLLAKKDAAREGGPTADPDGAFHRKDNPDLLMWLNLLKGEKALTLSELLDIYQENDLR